MIEPTPYELWLQNQANRLQNYIDSNGLDSDTPRFNELLSELLHRISIGEQGFQDMQTSLANERPGKED